MQEKRIIILVSLALLVAITLASSHEKTLKEKWLEWGEEECKGIEGCIPEPLVGYDFYENRFCRNDISPEEIFEDLPEPDDYEYCIPDEEFISYRSECGLP
ncbi:MAG: hypothetical protein JOS17DRAFT_494268 [Linnemannia elongata]|nr:MAG: hypothetical protein JOS17DRAFT_494268 [Linnemannia elongata]